MVAAAFVISILLFLSAAIHFVIACYFRTMVMLRPDETVPENSNDLASIVLAVRGCDPGLRHTLIRLLDQDHENYEIHLVVDHPKDSAWEIVRSVKSEFDVDRRLSIHAMGKPLKTCGLKCSALLQGLDNIHPDSKYLVLIDADVMPHRSWLRELIAPLNDKRIGVVTGNQWFEPIDGNIGSLVRSLWHAGSLVPTAIYSNPWAGSCAMRTEDVYRSKLPKIWRKSIVDDGPIRQAINPLGLAIHFCPSLVMVNREKCTLDFVRKYVSRTLTWSKMYEPTFLNTVMHCVATVGLLTAATVMAIVAVSIGVWKAAAILGIGLLAASIANVVSYCVVRNAITITSNLEGQEIGKLSPGRTIKLIFLSPVTYLIYGFSCLQAAVRQKIQWRQITYELRGKSSVKMLRYRPWTADETQKSETSEISI